MRLFSSKNQNKFDKYLILIANKFSNRRKGIKKFRVIITYFESIIRSQNNFSDVHQNILGPLQILIVSYDHKTNFLMSTKTLSKDSHVTSKHSGSSSQILIVSYNHKTNFLMSTKTFWVHYRF